MTTPAPATIPEPTNPPPAETMEIHATPPPIPAPAANPEVKSTPKTQPVMANQLGTQTGEMPIVAPPLPISAAKQAQLQALLERYKADLVTPAEYQAERAKILAEPDATTP